MCIYLKIRNAPENGYDIRILHTKLHTKRMIIFTLRARVFVLFMGTKNSVILNICFFWDVD